MRCFVAGDDAAATALVRDLLVSLGQVCPSSNVKTLDRIWGDLDKGDSLTRAKITDKAADRKPASELDLVVVLLAPDPEHALEVVKSNRRKTAARIVLVGLTNDTKLVLRALREGADEFLDQSDLKAELTAALKRLIVEAASGKMIAVISACGGSGCSTLAVNLAVWLAKNFQSCAALDLQLETGDLATLLDLKPAYSIADLSMNMRRLDPSLLDGCLIAHASGVQLLAAPRTFADGIKVTDACISEVLALATRRFPFTVADLGTLFRAERTRALLQVDLILVVLRLDFACLRSTRTSLDYLREIGVSADRIQVIGNRSGLPNEITASAAEKALGVTIGQYLPDDAKEVNRAHNNGVPVLLQSPSAKFSRAISDLAARISKAVEARNS